MGTIRVGLSGWSYDHWKGGFYPDDLPRRRWLEHVGRHFDAAEINGSFYSLQKASSFRRWREETPADFRFAVKGSRFITHDKKLRYVRGALANFFASGLLALEDKLGPVLWQLPARHAFDAERLEQFLDLLPRDTRSLAELAGEHDDRVPEPWLDVDANHRVRHVLEARHESFFTPEAVSVLRDAGVGLAVSHAGEWDTREELTAGFVYVRLHGAPDTYRSGYGPGALDDWARKARTWRDAGEPEDAETITDRAPPPRKSRDVWVFFDNDGEGRAPEDAEALRERVA